MPGRSGEFVFTTFMVTPAGGDIAMATSQNGGVTFKAQKAINNITGAGIDLPKMAVDPGATDGTVYVAWKQSGLHFRKVHVDTSGGVTLDPFEFVVPLPHSLAMFTMAVQHGSPNTVWLAYSDHGGTHDLGDCTRAQQTVTWWAASTVDDGASWRFQNSPIATDSNWKWCAGGQTAIGYGNDTQPDLLFAPGLNQLSVALAMTGPGGFIEIFVATSTPQSDGQNTWTVQKPPDQSGNFDQFRATFASFPTTSASQAFGLSWLRSDSSGNVIAKMTTSTLGATSWAEPLQVSAGSWTFPDDLTGDYGGMAAAGDGSNHLFPTWISRTSGADVTVAAEWSTP